MHLYILWSASREKIDNQVQQYIVLKALISVVAGFGCYVLYGPILQMQMAALFSVLTFLLVVLVCVLCVLRVLCVRVLWQDVFGEMLVLGY